MKLVRHAALALCALSAAIASAAKVDVAEYAGQALEAEQGAVILRVEWRRSTAGASKTTGRGDQDIFVVLREASGANKDRYVIAAPETIKAFVLPAGRWYVNEIFTSSSRNLPSITKQKQAMLQSFEVVAGKINYGGSFSLSLENDSEGEQSFNVTVEYPPEPVREAGEAFPGLFGAAELYYCPLGRKCKPPSAFRM